jgi:hypothetical protein
MAKPALIARRSAETDGSEGEGYNRSQAAKCGESDVLVWATMSLATDVARLSIAECSRFS